MRTYSLLIFFLLAGLNLCAQYYDAGLWASFGVGLEINKKLEIGIAPELRMDENGSRIASAFSDIGLQYKWNKQFSLLATYRGGTKRNNDFFDPRQRLQFGFGFKKKWSDFALTYQPRWQVSVSSYKSESDPDFNTVVRNRLKFQYSGIKKTDLSSSFELFNLTSQYYPLALQNWRWIIEVERTFNKRNSFSIGYLIQKNILSSPQQLDFVFLLSYQMKFELNKDEKKKKEEPSK